MSLRAEPSLPSSAASGSGADIRRPDLLFVDPEPDVDPSPDEVDWSAWQPPGEPGPVVAVTAVLVAHDGAAFLPRTLDAVEAQSRRPDRLIAVDAGSADGSADMLALATPDLVRVAPQTGFGDAVRAGLAAVGNQQRTTEEPAPEQLSVASGGSPVEWLWLLHDDSAPAPDALRRLIEEIDAGPSIGIAGCKQVSWSDDHRLLDVGFSTSLFGALVTGVDVDDIDQGQLDHRSDVLAVGTAGMLVRRDLWDRLGGPDPALPNARADLDLCRRAHLAGERVVVVPSAVMAHARASSSGLRGASAGSPDAAEAAATTWARRDRQAAIHLRLAWARLPMLPLLLVWLGAAAVLRALARLTLKQPDRALAEPVAYLLAAGRPAAWIRARGRIRRTRRASRISRREYRRLLAGTRPTLRQRRDRLSSYLRAQEEAWAEQPGAWPEGTGPGPDEPGSWPDEVGRAGAGTGVGAVGVAGAGSGAGAGSEAGTVGAAGSGFRRRGAGASSRRGWSVRRPRVDEMAQTPTSTIDGDSGGGHGGSAASGAGGMVVDLRGPGGIDLTGAGDLPGTIGPGTRSWWGGRATGSHDGPGRAENPLDAARLGEPRPDGSQIGESRVGEPRRDVRRRGESGRAVSRPGGLRIGRNRSGDPRPAETPTIESRSAETRSAETRPGTSGPGANRPDVTRFRDPDEIRFDDERDLPRRRASSRIGLLVALVTGTAALVALRVLLRGTGTPVGDALIPAPARASELWALGMSGWRPAGLGLAATADPFDLVLALISWPFAGSTSAGVQFLLIGALPLASLAAWWAAAALTRSRALRAWAALVWGVSPSLMVAVSAGRLGAIVAHLMLPLTALALTRTVGLRPAEPARPGLARRRRASMAAASGAGLALTVLISAAPALAGPALVAVLGLAVLARAGRRLLIWTVAVPAVLLAPWWTAVAADPRLLLAEPGGASALTPGAPGWAALLWPSDPAVIAHGPVHRLARLVAELTGVGDATGWLRAMAVLVVVPPLVLAVRAVTGGRRRRVTLTAGLLALLALGVAVAVPVADTRQGADGLLRGWSGPAVSLLLLALTTATLAHLDGAAGRLRARSIGAAHWGAVTMGALAVLMPLLTLTAWAADGWTAGPNRWVHRTDPEVLPAVAAAEADGDAATRTLAVQPTADGVRWTLYRTGGPRIGQESAATLTPSAAAARDAADEPVLLTIGALLSGSAHDQRDRFADLDIGSVLLLTGRPADPDGVQAAIAALDVAPGLVRVSETGDQVLWRVEPEAEAGSTPSRPARARVVSEDGDVLTTVPARDTDFTAELGQGEAGRLLVLSERADPGWTATLDGSGLEPVTRAGWAQAFELPRHGGTLVVRHDDPAGEALGLARLTVLGLALLVAVPLPRRRPRLLPPPKAWRPQRQPVQVASGSTGRRVRRPEQPVAGQEQNQAGADGPVSAYAEHQARMNELARRLALEAADAEDPMTARPSRRRRRAARRAAEAMAAEAAAEAAESGSAASAARSGTAEAESVAVGAAAARVAAAEDAKAAATVEVADAGTADASAAELGEEAPATEATPLPVVSPAAPEPAHQAHPLRPGRGETTRSLPPGPRASGENRLGTGAIPVPETPAEAGDSRPAESAPNPAGPADTAEHEPRNGDTASQVPAGETAGEAVPRRGGEPGEDESS
ncbi:glycosyltransferase [Kineosporia sp. J2-2]|uniref:Glycosyltransferase n=1 Tax=Kineosporia corallincola TaxID=2835133 RepID=A0ABS5TGW5_9ACTN|nr:glycosyltransferase [Kineosporia corallincola]MBT0770337.1 glycosyltransferase [Kineosporia corallincola]